MSEPVLMTLHASPPRRFLGVTMLAVLGLLLIYLAFAIPTSVVQVVLLGLGALGLFCAVKLYEATAKVLELTATELRVKGGPVLVELANMQKIERGAFSFKPSNGFLLSRKTAGARLWAPGLYWSFGRRLGVGGVTGAPQTKALAEAIANMIAERDLA